MHVRLNNVVEKKPNLQNAIESAKLSRQTGTSKYRAQQSVVVQFIGKAAVISRYINCFEYISCELVRLVHLKHRCSKTTTPKHNHSLLPCRIRFDVYSGSLYPIHPHSINLQCLAKPKAIPWLNRTKKRKKEHSSDTLA